METMTCTSCHKNQHVHTGQIVTVDEGSFQTVTWWRCRVCDQLSPTARTIMPAVSELALSA